MRASAMTQLTTRWRARKNCVLLRVNVSLGFSFSMAPWSVRAVDETGEKSRHRREVHANDQTRPGQLFTANFPEGRMGNQLSCVSCSLSPCEARGVHHHDRISVRKHGAEQGDNMRVLQATRLRWCCLPILVIDNHDVQPSSGTSRTIPPVLMMMPTPDCRNSQIGSS